MRQLILLTLPFCMALGLCSCTWTQGIQITSEIVRNYPSDNFAEEALEGVIEDKLGLEEDSLDLTPFSKEE